MSKFWKTIIQSQIQFIANKCSSSNTSSCHSGHSAFYALHLSVFYLVRAPKYVNLTSGQKPLCPWHMQSMLLSCWLNMAAKNIKIVEAKTYNNRNTSKYKYKYSLQSLKSQVLLQLDLLACCLPIAAAVHGKSTQLQSVRPPAMMPGSNRFLLCSSHKSC